MSNFMAMTWALNALIGTDWDECARNVDRVFDRFRPPLVARQRRMSPEEARLDSFWRDYYKAVGNFNHELSNLDWVAYYKNHGTLIRGGPCGGPDRIQFAPQIVMPRLEFVPAGAAPTPAAPTPATVSGSQPGVWGPSRQPTAMQTSPYSVPHGYAAQTPPTSPPYSVSPCGYAAQTPPAYPVSPLQPSPYAASNLCPPTFKLGGDEQVPMGAPIPGEPNPKKACSKIQRIYDVATFLKPGAFDGPRFPCGKRQGKQARAAAPVPSSSEVAQQLIDVITTCIEPGSWSGAGGPGAIRYFAPGRLLIVSQTDRIHDQIEDLLTQLRTFTAANEEDPSDTSGNFAPVSPPVTHPEKIAEKDSGSALVPAENREAAVKSATVTASPITQVHCFWNRRLMVVNQGIPGSKPLAGISGRVYFFDSELKNPLTAQGQCSLKVTMAYTLPDGKPQTAIYEFRKQDIDALLSRDSLGWGYTLPLPWAEYRPGIEDVSIRVTLLQENGDVVSSRPVCFVLETPAPPTGTQQVPVAGKVDKDDAPADRTIQACECRSEPSASRTFSRK